MSTPSPRRRLGALGAAAAVAATLVMAVAAPASAHVKVDGEPAAGGYAVLTFRVPTESDTASTTGLKVTFPDDTPIVSVSTQPKPGWTAHVETDDLPKPQTDGHGNEITAYVSSVTWTADDAGIAPGEFDTFAVSAGPIPDADSLAFPAAQSYSDGTVVNWDEIAQGGAEPEHPAPSVAITPADDAAAPADADDAAPAGDGTDGATAASSSGDGFGIAGLVAGIAGVILAFIAIARGGRGKAAGGR